ncbi:CHAT domain-containing protein, partial [Mastigocoleus testarum]
ELSRLITSRSILPYVLTKLAIAISLAIMETTLGKQHPDVAQILNNLAELYWLKGDITHATNFFTRASEIQEQNLKLIFTRISEQRKQYYIRTFSGTTSRIISLSLGEARNNPKVIRLALTNVLRRKGRVLDTVTNSTQILRSQLKNNPQAKQLFDEWLEVQQQLSALVYKELGKQTPAQYKARYQKLEARREELEEAINVKSAEFRNEFEPVELAAVQAKIPKNAGLVEIVQYEPFNPKAKKQDKYFGKPRYAAAILRNQGQPKWVDLGEATAINKSVFELRKALLSKSKLSKNDSASPEKRGGVIPGPADGKYLNELARNLDEQVMKLIRPHLGNARHLLLSPDGQLNLIPFEALRDEKGKYLIERYAFSYLTSGRDLLRFDSSASNNSTPVVFADIDYDQKETTVATSTRGDSRNRRSTDLASLKYGALEATSKEAQQIKSIFTNTKIISKKQATETALKQLQSPSILHLATHGFFLPDVEVDLPTFDAGLITNKIAKPTQKIQLENPLLRSGLALAGFNNRNQASASSNDGVLTALEVVGLDLKGTELVVLSACETGLGDVKVGEGLYGLRRALVMAGSQSQVLSLWLVDDAGTKDLMVKYYQGLKAGKGRHEALREAQLELLSTAGYEHPYYWASFVPSGNWRALDMKKNTYHE